MGKFIDLSGERFGRLVVKSKSKTKIKDQGVIWNCLCDCGRKHKVNTKSIKSGNTRSCGCLRAELRSGANNHQARKNIERCGGIFISSDDPWYQCAERIKTSSKGRGIRFGFGSSAEFALYLKNMAPDRCPVFGTKFERGSGKPQKTSPSVDKIIPSKGYVKGNIQIISYLANRMKNDATPKQLRQFIEWATK